MRREAFTKQTTRRVQARGDGPFGDSEQHRDGSGVELLELTEHEDFSMQEWQLEHNSADVQPSFTSVDNVVSVGCVMASGFRRYGTHETKTPP